MVTHPTVSLASFEVPPSSVMVQQFYSTPFHPSSQLNASPKWKKNAGMPVATIPDFSFNMADTDVAPDRNNEISINDYNTYEDYLDAQITPIDLYYLEDKDLARQLVELGYRGTGEPLKREEFEARKRAQETSRHGKRLLAVQVEKDQQKAKEQKAASSDSEDDGTETGPKSGTQEATANAEPSDAPHVVSTGLTPFLKALLEREEANRSGKMTSILFIRDRNAKNQEISGYIDLAQRLKTENFDDYFNQTRKLLPKPNDLSFYNWDTHTCTATSSGNFQVIAEGPQGILFKNKRDRKTVSVDPKDENPGDNTTRVEIVSPEYAQLVIYDHIIRRKT